MRGFAVVAALRCKATAFASSAQGTQQGDACGPLFFSVTLQGVLEAAQTPGLVTVRSVVRDLAYPLLAVKVPIGRGLKKISSAQKNRDFCIKKSGFFFDIVKPL